MGRPYVIGRCVGNVLYSCKACGEQKPAGEFYRARGRNGLSEKPQSYCVQCHNKRTKARHVERWANDERYREGCAANSRRGALDRKYGVSVEGYAALLATQAGCCAICGAIESHKRNGKSCRLAVDHNHKTGRVRGLLCVNCNRLVGIIESRSGLLAKAEIYVKRYSDSEAAHGEQAL